MEQVPQLTTLADALSQQSSPRSPADTTAGTDDDTLLITSEDWTCDGGMSLGGNSDAPRVENGAMAMEEGEIYDRHCRSIDRFTSERFSKLSAELAQQNFDRAAATFMPACVYQMASADGATQGAAVPLDDGQYRDFNKERTSRAYHHGDEAHSRGRSAVRRRYPDSRRQSANSGNARRDPAAPAREHYYERPITEFAGAFLSANIAPNSTYILLDLQFYRRDVVCEYAIGALVLTGHTEQSHQTLGTTFGLVGAEEPFSALSRYQKHRVNARREEVNGLWYTTYDNGRNTHCSPAHMNSCIAETIASIMHASVAPVIVLMKGRDKLDYFSRNHPQFASLLRILPEPLPQGLLPCSRYVHHSVPNLTSVCAFANVYYMQALLDKAGFLAGADA